MNVRPYKMRLGLLWHSVSSDNLGVGALTIAHISILEAAARRVGISPEFVVLGWSDQREPYVAQPGLDVVQLRMKDFVKPRGGLYGHLRECDLVCDISAGDSFTDIYGPKRFGTMLGAKMLTLAARKPLILSPQTFGPFQGALARQGALSVMRRASVVSARDALSSDFLRDIGYTGSIVEASDVALRLPFTKATRAVGGPLRVGVNVSGLLFNGGYSGANMFGLKAPYADTIRALLGRLTSRNDVEVHLVAHVISDNFEVEDDYRVCQMLAGEFSSAIVAPKFKDPIEAKTYISGMDFFAGARMHACIAAFSANVPVLPMAYSRKFKGLFGTLGYDVLADCQNDTTAELIDKFDNALDQRDELASTIRSCLESGLNRLQRYEDAVVEQMRAVLSSR